LGGAIPDLSISITHGFSQGQAGANYIISVAYAGHANTVGAVGVIDTLPSGFTATAISGNGRTCVLATVTCTRSDSLAAGASYPDIVISVNIAAGLTGNATDTATVSGDLAIDNGYGANSAYVYLGGEFSGLGLSSTHTRYFVTGQTGARPISSQSAIRITQPLRRP
jgi:hypothetical protein